MASIISTKTSGGGGIAVTGDTSGVLQLASNNGTTAVTIDASQNVGIGTTSPQSKTSFAASSANYLTFQNSAGSSIYAAIGVDSGAPELVSGASANDTVIRTNQQIWFALSGGQSAGRFDSSGNFLFNSGYGSVATAYGCRAWVNFNGTGTVAIRASGNVSSITDNGTGDYTVNFTTAMPDANYSIFGSGKLSTFNNPDVPCIGFFRNTASPNLTTSARISSTNTGGGAEDAPIVCVNIIR
jgi:hypothetical protein